MWEPARLELVALQCMQAVKEQNWGAYPIILLETDVASNAKHNCRAYATQQRWKAPLGQEADETAQCQERSIRKGEAEVVHDVVLRSTVALSVHQQEELGKNFERLL